MNHDNLKKRTQEFALSIINLVQSLPKGQASLVIGNQLTKSGTSVGANYRSACRARSRAEFIAKMGIVEEEADETIYWIELLIKAGLIKKDGVKPLLKEAHELLAITVSSINTARKSKK